ncbi:MAG TPA: choice-of-anchor D domain-containing protein [Actinomycetota bacterium]
MSDGRLTVVIAGNVYLSADGVRLFLEGSGYDVAALVSTPAELRAAVAARRPDAVIVGDELAGDDEVAALRGLSPDTRIVVVTSRAAPAPEAPDRADAYVSRGAPLAAITAALATLLVDLPLSIVATAPGSAELAAVPRPGPGRLRVLQFVAAAALAFGLGGLVLVFSGGTREIGGPRALPGTGTPGTVFPGSPTPGSTLPAASALQDARTSLSRLVQAIQASRFDLAVSEARTMISDRQQAERGGLSMGDFDAEVLSSLQPVVALLPADMLPMFRSILGGLLPPVGAQIQIVGGGTFGQVQVGSSSGVRNLVIGNAGDQDLQFSGIQIAGASASQFSQSSDCAQSALPPGGSCTVEISFTPTAPGEKVATLVVQAQDVAASASLPLAGTGVVVPPPDTEPPVILCGQPGPGWTGADLVITCTAQDGGSGLEAAGDASFSLATHVPAGTEDGNAFTGTRTVCDRDGNCAQAGPIGGIKVDKRAPQVSCEKPDRSWQADNATVTCRSQDHGSGLASEASFALVTTVPRDVENADAQTGSRPVCDAVDNCVTAGPIGGFKIDRRAPKVTCDHSDAAWHRDDVQVGCSAEDAGSGVQPRSDASFTLSTNVPAGTADGNAATDTQRVCDAVGNCVTAGPIRGFRIDKAAPWIALSGLANGATYLLNQSVSVGAPVTCSDEGSGVATCSVPNTVDTSAVGVFSFTATATDEVGNTATTSVSYSVTYGVQLRFDTTEETRKIELRLVDANGTNVSSSSIVVTALDIDGETSLGRRFTYSKNDQEYSFAVPGKVDSGPHVLHLTASDDPVTHAVSFVYP